MLTRTLFYLAPSCRALRTALMPPRPTVPKTREALPQLRSRDGHNVPRRLAQVRQGVP